jgi:hypothetical protein
VPESVLAGLESPSTRVRIAAIKALERRASAGAVALIEGKLSDDDASVRASAVESLGALDSVESLPLVEALVHDRDPLVRAAAVRTKSRLIKVARARPGPPVLYAEVEDAADLSKSDIAGLAAALTESVRTELSRSNQPGLRIVERGATSGFGLLLVVRSVKTDRAASSVAVRCELTLVQLPARKLLMAANATPTVTVEGTLGAARERTLAIDAAQACGPPLATDFLAHVNAAGLLAPVTTSGH